eukprot:234205-Pelagomonas_calceolata.AAC.1
MDALYIQFPISMTCAQALSCKQCLEPPVVRKPLFASSSWYGRKIGVEAILSSRDAICARLLESREYEHAHPPKKNMHMHTC